MFRKILVPTKENHKISLPPDLYGKQVEVIAFEIESIKAKPSEKKKFLDDIDVIPDFPSIESIRKEAWPKKK